VARITGFLELGREDRGSRPPAERLRHFNEFTEPLAGPALQAQASRCMDCGIPYCHSGCPVHNRIPDWNDLVWRGDWEKACRDLHLTNNFPEFTGRICPAPCEAACTLNLIEQPVTIKTIEHAIVERGWAEGWLVPQPAATPSGKRVAVVGAGPAGLACAQQLARAGHEVHVFEKNARAGGLLRYGIPDFKLEKAVIDRRLGQIEAEGVRFHFNTHVGVTLPAAELREQFDAVVLAGGAEQPRDLAVDGRALAGVHFAMEFLPQQNRRNSGEAPAPGAPILATGRHVVVIGGGDTGSDCIGTALRQGALSVTQLEIMPMPPEHEAKLVTWPDWPLKLRVSSSHEEGAVRDFAVMTRRLVGEGGRVSALEAVRLDPRSQPLPASAFRLPAGLVLLATGFVHPVHEGMLAGLGVALDGRGNVAADTLHYRTSLPGVFAAGDMRRGQSLVVWAIREGRQAARAVDLALTGATVLPR